MAEVTFPHDLIVVAGAGVIAGAVNSVAGGGSLLSFPVLISTGLSPLAANVTNTVGLFSGQIGAALGYRTELEGQRARLGRLAVPMVLGSIAGAAILLTTPAGVFKVVVPWLIVLACLALLLQPRLQSLIERDASEKSLRLRIGLFAGGMYGGYFGAALGVMLLALLILFVHDTVQRLNASKVVLTGFVNAIAAVAFLFFGPVHWLRALVLAVFSLIGGAVGARLGRRIPGQALRIGVAVVGLGIAAWLVMQS